MSGAAGVTVRIPAAEPDRCLISQDSTARFTRQRLIERQVRGVPAACEYSAT